MPAAEISFYNVMLFIARTLGPREERPADTAERDLALASHVREAPPA